MIVTSLWTHQTILWVSKISIQKHAGKAWWDQWQSRTSAGNNHLSHYRLNLGTSWNPWLLEISGALVDILKKLKGLYLVSSRTVLPWSVDVTAADPGLLRLQFWSLTLPTWFHVSGSSAGSSHLRHRMPWVVMMFCERSMDSEERSIRCIVVLESIKNPSMKKNIGDW